MRHARGSRSAPEELIEIASAQFAPRPSDDARTGDHADAAGRQRRHEFSESIWVSLSIGRNQKAEPRWLIPMICRNGGLSKRDIGQIKLMPDQSMVQLEAEAGERFLKALGSRTLARGISVTRLEGTPDLSRAGQRRAQDDARRYPKKPNHSEAEASAWQSRPKRDFGPRPAGEVDTRRVDTSNRRSNQPFGKPRDGKKGKGRAKR